MDSLDFNTRLPPRKRLLAGLKKDSSECDFLLPTSDTFDRLRELISSRTSSPDDIIETSKSAALAATKVAAAARTTAVEKAMAAAKAKAAAKNALELLATLSRCETSREGPLCKTKSRKRHVPIKLLYKNKQTVGVRETDEELARRLHHAMNSSLRISKKSQKHSGLGRDGSLLDSTIREVPLSRKPVDKLEEKVLVCSKAEIFERESDDNALAKDCHGSSFKGFNGGKKAKVKKKKLLLSQCTGIEQGCEPRRWPATAVHSSTADYKLECQAKSMPSTDVETFDETDASTKITSIWRCKKLKLSQCSSDTKLLHTLCPNTAVTKASSVVKFD